MLNVAMSIAVGAETREELERRVEALRDRFGTVCLHRPLGLQAALFMDHLPRADGGQVRDYADVLTVEQLRRADADRHTPGRLRAGRDDRAHTAYGGHRPVKFDITEASRASRPPSILLAGTLGSGKTIAAQLLAYHAERRGSLVVDVDPKPDHNLEGLPESRRARASDRTVIASRDGRRLIDRLNRLGRAGERDADPRHPAARRRRRDREPDRHPAHLRPGDGGRGAARARAARRSTPRTARWSSGCAATGAAAA